MYYYNYQFSRLSMISPLWYKGERKHDSVYTEISKDALCNIIGLEFVYLLQKASLSCADYEKNNCGKLCMNPTLKFTDEFNTSTSQYYSSQGKRSTSTVEFVKGSGPRFYDTKDFIKDKYKCPLQNDIILILINLHQIICTDNRSSDFWCCFQ